MDSADNNEVGTIGGGMRSAPIVYITNRECCVIGRQAGSAT